MPGSSTLLSVVALAACTAGQSTDEGNLNGAYVLSETGPHPGSHKTNDKFPTQFKVNPDLFNFCSWPDFTSLAHHPSCRTTRAACSTSTSTRR
jgi:hypothetical protein